MAPIGGHKNLLAKNDRDLLIQRRAQFNLKGCLYIAERDPGTLSPLQDSLTTDQEIFSLSYIHWGSLKLPAILLAKAPETEFQGPSTVSSHLFVSNTISTHTSS